MKFLLFIFAKKIKLSLWVSLLLILNLACNSSLKPPSTTPELTDQLFLLSKGLETAELKDAFLSFLKHPPEDTHLAIIPNASSSEKKMQKKFAKIRGRMLELGLDSKKVEYFDIQERNPEELLGFDLIYLLGGNPYRLLKEVRVTKTDNILHKYFESGKQIMAYSAGVLLLGPHLEMFDELDPLLGFKEEEMQDLRCLGLYDFLVFPHYDEFTAEVPGLAQAIQTYTEESNTKIHLISDHQALLYRSKAITLIP